MGDTDAHFHFRRSSPTAVVSVTLSPTPLKSLAGAFFLGVIFFFFFRDRFEMMRGEWKWKMVATRVGPRLPPATSLEFFFFALCEMMEGTAAKPRFERLTPRDESPGYELLAS